MAARRKPFSKRTDFVPEDRRRCEFCQCFRPTSPAVGKCIRYPKNEPKRPGDYCYEFQAITR